MESQGPQPTAGVSQAPLSRGCCSSSRPTGAWFACKDPGGGSRPVKTPAVAEGPASGLPRNVLSERERRKRISVSCERLRALLPRFDGRKEDMASVLEMSVQFLRMAGAVVPGGEPQPASCQVLAPCTELWGVWQKDVVQLALTSPTSASAPDPGTAASVTTQRDPGSCVTTEVGQGAAPRGLVEVPDRPAALPGSPRAAPACSSFDSSLGAVRPASLFCDGCLALLVVAFRPPVCVCRVSSQSALGGEAAPFYSPGPSGSAPWTPAPSPSQLLRAPPAWPPCSWQPSPPLLSEEAQSCSGQSGTLAEEANQAVMLGTRAPLSLRTEDKVDSGALRGSSRLSRSALGCDVEDGPSFPLAASPEWWLGSLEGSGAPAQAPARSSLLDRTELGVLVDPGAGSQELLDGPLEPWGWDVGCPSLAFRDEADSMFPDFSAC
ncbi:spermatogenesis- and oogenesis-specific basic helix-loop-helix-containing protein 1 [Molossus nigricans]